MTTESPAGSAAGSDPTNHACGELLDLATFARRVGGEVDLIRELLEAFRGTIETKRSALNLACDNVDAEAVRSAAHSVAGAAANISAARLEAHARAMESACVHRTVGEACAIRERVNSTIDETVGEIARALADELSALR
jgi:two-component system, sensor histidine kinase and response regulator